MKNETILLMRKGLSVSVLYVFLALLLPALTNAQGWFNSYDWIEEFNLRSGTHLRKLTDGTHYVFGWASKDEEFSFVNYIMKMQDDGEVLWIEELDLTYYNSIVTSDGNVVIYSNDQFKKIDATGSELWMNDELLSNTNKQVFHPVEAGGFLILENISFGVALIYEIASDGTLQNTIDVSAISEWSTNQRLVGIKKTLAGDFLMLWSETGQHKMAVVNSMGELLLEQTYTDINGIIYEHIQTSDNHLIIAGSYNNNSGSFIRKLSETGEVLWSNDIGSEDYYISSLIESNDGSIAFAMTPNSVIYDDLLFFKINPEGEILTSMNYTLPEALWFDEMQISLTDTDGYLMSTSAFGVLDTVGHFWRTDANGDIFANQLKGNVYHDLNTDCLPDAGEMGLVGWIVYADGENDFYTVTDANGDYLMEVDTGDYDLELIYPFPYWQACVNPYSFSIALGDTVVSDFPTQSLTDCPGMYVDISTPFVRHCMDANYYVHYCNYGTQDATDVYVEVTVDPLYTYLGASITPTSIVGNVYTFDLGTVPVGACGDFTIDVTLEESCDSIVIGQTFCMEAHIFPDSLCMPDTSGWDGSSIELTANCTGTEVIFEIINVGEDMEGAPREYIVIEDNIMFDSGLFLLASGQTEDVGFPANGSTYRLEAQQANGHPGNSMPAIVVEGCDADGDGDFSIGYYTQLPEDDADPFISIDCQESIAPYDPNDKRGYPSGYDVEHFIAANQDIEYIIRFQNLGNDTAFVVVVEDQLVAELDPTTVRPGASSFPYTFQIVGDGKLVFTFDQIKLPPESTDEAGSIGFVKFRVSQRADLEEGTVINNEANIFFDFNEPILTNQTLHTVAYEFVTVSSEEVYVPGVSVNVFPNPFIEAATLEVEGYETTMFMLYIYDLAGRQLRLERHDQSTITLQRKGLAAGVYTYRLEAEGQLIGVGKIVVQ